MMIKGEIFYALDRSNAEHPYIYIRKETDDFFIGVMLTHARDGDYGNKNILMAAEHFKDTNKEGIKYEVVFDDSHCVKAKLLKGSDWDRRKVGELTKEGIRFVESVIDLESAKLWSEYRAE